ncbi:MULTISPECIES: Dabb family protein [Mycobacteriaceae]|uniref:Dabb family protein n=1 Tax=Mycobacteriaceae TaxID=1762 RepID=UPI0007FFFE43|nr:MULTISPECIES: Dabb family protein [Mycobacteriaceae]MCK0175429.1 Dabb family protein [Mycolicibacterium sp. F2034L]OBB59938.1 stress responsive protein [Mycobacterium sp. 852013-51886_SCH5428379]
MYSVIRLIEAPDEAQRSQLLSDIRSAAAGLDAEHVVVEPTLPGVRNGGDILAHLRFTDRRQGHRAVELLDGLLSGPAVSHCNGATYDGTPVPGAPGDGTVYRTLLLRVKPGTDDAVVRRFEDDLRLLPRHVRTIHTWQLSRVETAIGTVPWTHVFEQEFTDVDGLMGPYLMHPIHWAVVDQWFDPECPQMIVRDRVCHSFCDLPG